jgi:hypothetical protein
LIIYSGGHDPKLPTYHFTFPDGVTETLKFNQSEWRYYWHRPDGVVPLDGISGITKICTPTQVIKNWAVKVALLRTKKLLMDGGYVYLDGDTKSLYESVLDDILAKAKKEDDDILQDAGRVGTDAHDWLEHVIKARDNEERRLELFAKFPPDERAASCCIAGIDWIVRHSARYVYSERKVFSRSYRYAGTLDAVAYVSSCDDPSCCPHPYVGERLCILDYKSSNALRVGYLFQVAAYRHALIEELGIKIEDTWILRLDKSTGEFDPWHIEGSGLFEEDFKGFLNCLETCRSIARAEDRVGGVIELRTARRRAAEKVVRDEQYKIECPESKNYKGSRQKKGCNGTETVCAACTQKYKDNHQ